MFIGLPTSAVAAGPPRRGQNPPGTGPAVAPAFAVPPVLSGSGTIGALLVVTAKATGNPAPLLSFQWLRDGAPIPGAGGPGYLPAPADDLAAIRCRVTAINSVGSAEAESPAVIARHAVPVALGLADRSFATGTGAQHIVAADGFEGAGLIYALEGPPGLVIDPATGVLTVPIAAPFGPATITVSATNSGGAAEIGFTLAVLAADPEKEGDNVIRFDTIAQRFDTTAARFDGSTALAAASFDSTVLRFDTTAVRFDGAQFAPAPGVARFDTEAVRFDTDTLRFDVAVVISEDELSLEFSQPSIYDEAA